MNPPHASSRPQPSQAEACAHRIREQIPPGGLFAGHEWRIAIEPFRLDPALVRSLESLGRVLLQFYQAVNLLYRQSVEGRQPQWIAGLLDQGKPSELIQLQRSHTLKHEWPRVIRPDLLLTESGLRLIELDSVPGGIGLTAWMNQVYSSLPGLDRPWPVLGGQDGMRTGFAGIFGDAPRVHIVVSEESATYRPEMIWLADSLDPARFRVHGPEKVTVNQGEAVYRFFELFDLAHVPCAWPLFQSARERHIQLTPPPKPIFEEKLLFGLLWNRHLDEFWRRQLGEAFLQRLRQTIPFTWILDPTPLPPQGVFPDLNLTDWHQLKSLSQRQRNLVLKISGFSEHAWGSRGVYLGSDLSSDDWAQAVDRAIRGWPESPFILQPYQKPTLIPAAYFDFNTGHVQPMNSRVRLCPYYFVHGTGTGARPHLGGVLATLCPADKKLIHGMSTAILAPCMSA